MSSATNQRMSPPAVRIAGRRTALLRQRMGDVRTRHHRWTREYGEDLPEVLRGARVDGARPDRVRRVLGADRLTEIAQQLVLTTDTVRSHINHILRKLGVHSRREAVEIAQHLRHEPG